MTMCISPTLFWIFSILIVALGNSPCNKNIVWEKVKGMKPESAIEDKYLYRGVDSQGIVSACFQKCKSSNCSAFIIDFKDSYCYTIKWALNQNQSNEFVPEPNVTFYHQICLKVPPSCLTKYWQVERIIGAILYDNMARKTVPEVITRAECYETCIRKGKDCKAAQFRSSRDLFVDDTVGNCSLLTIERELKPQAYGVSSFFRDEYLENQCHNISKTEYCSYAELPDVLMPYSDLKLMDLNMKQCEERCNQNADGFLCRAYGINYTSSSSSSSSNNNRPICYLYSESTIGNGASSLIASPRSYYREREPCIDMDVHCSNSTLSVELRTAEPFFGRLYVSGYSENCSVLGNGEHLTTLLLPLPDPNKKTQEIAEPTCGLTASYSVDPEDHSKHTIIGSIVIIQFNPIIQRLGDQAVRVGCAISTGSIPNPQNVTVHSQFTFVDPNAGLPPIVSTVINSSSEVPTVSMVILDERLNPANVTHLGQKLILKIQMSGNQGPFDIMAGHLIASSHSGDSALLLLDDFGCPVTKVFPALEKDPTDNRSLVATFSAFKFPNSQHVRFNVIVKFCLQICNPVKCKDGKLTYGRKKRMIENEETTQIAFAKVRESNSRDNNTVEELPLQATIIVQDTRAGAQNITPNPLKSKHVPDTFLILDDHMEGQFCMDSSLMLFLLMFFLIIQIILISSCIFAVRNYRRLAIRAEEDRADILARHLYGMHSGNFDISRRVRWADNNSSTLS